MRNACDSKALYYVSQSPCRRRCVLRCVLALWHARTTWHLTSHTLTMLQSALDNIKLQNSRVLFAFAVFTAAVELGITAYLLASGIHMRGASYHTLFVYPRLILFGELVIVLLQIHHFSV